jgi:hypothetical protein
MQTFMKALLGFGLGSAQMLAVAPAVRAADVDLTPVKKASVRVIKRVKVVHRVRTVRDYDGTPVVIRVAPPRLQRDALRLLYETIPAPRATPRYYLNGQPVMPTTAVLRRYRG